MAHTIHPKHLKRIEQVLRKHTGQRPSSTERMGYTHRGDHIVHVPHAEPVPTKTLHKIKMHLEKKHPYHTIRVGQKKSPAGHYNVSVEHIMHPGAASYVWWKNLTRQEQKDYIAKHPGTKFKVGASFIESIEAMMEET